MTNDLTISTTSNPFCPACGAEIREEKRSYYCRLAAPGTPSDEILLICAHPNELKKAMEKSDPGLGNDPCIDCDNFAVLVEDYGTLINVEMLINGPALSFREIHRCWRCGADFSFTRLAI